jgi:predicted TIM-barrel fold metal-dependent hydrolase
MIIDGHAHAAGKYANAESVLDTAKKYQIERVLLVTAPKNNRDLKAPPNIPFMKSPDSIFLLNRMLRMAYRAFKDGGDGNQYVFSLRDQIPGILAPFLWVNPLDPQHMADLEKNIQDYRPAGIKLHQAWDAFRIDGRQFNQLVEIARYLKLPIFIHLYSQGEARKLLQFSLRNRQVVFIIGHMLGLGIFKEKRAELPNLYFDTSGSERVRSADILNAVQNFGDDHVVFGTDNPYAGIEEQIHKIDALPLPDRVKEQIFRANTRNLLALKT